MFGCIAQMQEHQINFDAFLEKTSYAVLLKELIGLTDTIGLLRCRMPKDERRFVEDSILGKTVRVRELFKHTDLTLSHEDDIKYLSYWIALAKEEALPELLAKYITDLERVFYKMYLINTDYKGKES